MHYACRERVLQHSLASIIHDSLTYIIVDIGMLCIICEWREFSYICCKLSRDCFISAANWVATGLCSIGVSLCLSRTCWRARSGRRPWVCRQSSGASAFIYRNVSFFECFPYVCPEPVLVKWSFLFTNGVAKKVAFFAPASGPPAPWPSSAPRWSPH
eukprot:COSAG06_NODE_27141_length_599_cov_15.512000_1_plen_156_part_01